MIKTKITSSKERTARIRWDALDVGRLSSFGLARSDDTSPLTLECKGKRGKKDEKHWGKGTSCLFLSVSN